MGYDDRDDDDYDDLNVRRSYQEIPNYLTQAILVTLCCCLPFGIVAIINATQVTTHLTRGEYEQAMRASDEAKKWCWLGFGIGLVINLIGGILQFGLEMMRF